MLDENTRRKGSMTDSVNVGSRPAPRPLLHLEALKKLVQEKFESVLEAFVFFDHMKVNFVSTMNLKRGLLKLEANDLVSNLESLVRDLQWKCVDHGRVHLREFVDLLQWHPIMDMQKELSSARLAFDRQKRAEQNKDIRLKVKKPQRPTPVCDNLREILKSKYKSLATFMVVADMDTDHVISFRDLLLAFRKECIEGINVEELAIELSDPSFPPTGSNIKTHSFLKALRWEPLETVESAMKDERLAMFRERNKLKKGLAKIKLAPNSLPFFRERPEVEKAIGVMRKRFENAADAFVFFDTDNAGEITRVKMAHGLKRLQDLEGGDVTFDIDKLMPEMQNLQFTCGAIDAAGFISNFRWHDKFPDINEAVWTARRKKFARVAVVPQQQNHRRTDNEKIKYSNKKTGGKSTLPLVFDSLELDTFHGSTHSSARSKFLQQTTNVYTEKSSWIKGTPDEVHNKRFAKAKVDDEGRARPSRLSDGEHVSGADIYNDQLETYKSRRVQPHPTFARPMLLPPHQPLSGRAGGDSLKRILQERGFKDPIDAYSFFDVDKKGSITRSDMQKGLLDLQIVKITAKMLPFPKKGLDGIARMDLLHFLELYAWDDSLDRLLALPHPEVLACMVDSYNRSEEIRAAVLREAAKTAEKSNADLKAHIFHGLTNLPPLPLHRHGSQTDRCRGPAVGHVKGNGRKNDGFQTERGRVRDSMEKGGVQGARGHRKGLTGARGRSLQQESSSHGDVKGGFTGVDDAKVRNTDKFDGEENSPASVQVGSSSDVVASPDSLPNQEIIRCRIKSSGRSQEDMKTQESDSGERVPEQGSDSGDMLPGAKHESGRTESSQVDPADEVQPLVATVEPKNLGDENDDVQDILCNILDEDPKNEVPQDPRGALLAEKFIKDNIKRVETKVYIYEGQVNSEGKPHGHGVKFFRVRTSTSPSEKTTGPSTETPHNKYHAHRQKLIPPPTEVETTSPVDHWQVGRFVKGKIMGPGMMRTPDGAFYFGDFKEGKRHGVGMSISEVGIVYEGEFFNDLRDGCGCVWAKMGPAYFGEWQLDKRHGSGLSGSCAPAMLQQVR